jgi:hypothetical protein
MTVPSSPTPSGTAPASNPVAAALEAFKSGKDVEQAVYGTSTMKPKIEMEAPADETDVEQEKEDSPEPEALDQVEASEKQPDVEELVITDEDGKRKKLKVDWNDREKLKKVIQRFPGLEKGMRKFQAERDQAQAKLKDVEPKLQRLGELEESWKAVEEAYRTAGVKGLVNLLENRQDAYDQWESSVVEKRKTLEKASPEELKAFKLEEELQKERRERERFQKQIEEDRKRADEAREEAGYKAFESRVTPAFEKYRMAGKLGDPVAEHQLDKAIWTEVLDRLEQYREAAKISDDQIPSDVIEKEFRTISATFQKIVQKTADQAVKTTIAKKKEAAQENAATKAMTGVRSNDAKDAFKKDIRSGNLVGALRSMFEGKVRL